MANKVLNVVNKAYDVYQGVKDEVNDLLGNKFQLRQMFIGVKEKNYEYMRRSLFRNIGNKFYYYDGFGSVIGTPGDTMLNYKTEVPWFYEDYKKNSTSNYIDYIKSISGNDDLLLSNFNKENITQTIPKKEYDVGVVRGVEVGKASPNIFDSYSSKRNGDDTRLGYLSDYFLNETIKISTSTTSPDKGITKQDELFRNFRNGSTYSISYGGETLKENKVNDNKTLFGEAIPWSTADNCYDSNKVWSNNHLEGLSNELGVNKNSNEYKMLSQKFIDETRGSDIGTLYYPFGNFYSTTYSEGMIDSSTDKTKSFILASMFGISLMRDDLPRILNSFKSDGSINNKHINKRYYARRGSRGSNYIDSMTSIDVGFEHYRIDGKKQLVRIKLNDVGNDNLWSCRTLFTYGEAEGNTVGTPDGLNSKNTYNNGVDFGSYFVYGDVAENTVKRDIIKYTNNLFLNNKLDTLIGRFHSNEFNSVEESRASRDMLNTAVSKYGISHGRNLLKRDTDDKVHGYSNPYCRVWTFHHQYSKLNDTIRPFLSDDGINLESSEVNRYRTEEGLSKLKKYGVKGSNGLVKIAPTKSDDIKKCMFSIENLAWKGEKEFFKGYEDQKGPLGGRIMWFPPYDLKIDESVNVNWNANQFIGRGENIYTYTNTERSGSLSFKLLIDHPSVINSYRGDVNGVGDVDDIESNEQSLLRFFAGCDILTSKVKKKKKKTEETKVKVKPVEINKKIENTAIVFSVYFPNNYSGAEEENEDFAIDYLMFGYGAAKYEISGQEIDSINNNLIVGYEKSNSGISFISKDVFLGPDRVFRDYDIVTMNRQNKIGKMNHWGYRVDESVSNEVLSTKINYSDTKSFKLNSNGYTKNNHLKQYNDKNILYSFEDVYFAIKNNDKHRLTDKQEKIKNLLNTYKIEYVDIISYASSHGTKKSNKKLYEKRGETIKKWLKRNLDKGNNINYISSKESKIGPKLNHKDISELDAKIWRSVTIKINLSKEEIIGVDNINHYDNETQRSINVARYFAEENNVKTRKELKNLRKDFNDVQVVSTDNILEDNRAIADSQKLKTANGFNSRAEDVDGYGNEYKFFDELSESDPILHNKIVEKIKYFDPAFHSISPEGFQSRLTFLHQCTRQGNTNSRTDSKAVMSTANNLSFGRPPICVLRLGDFFNTKIIIDNLSISYDDTTWDLNDEGIGVMPMMANIRLSFKFLGGSDLSGPITRLQNALSFNHYGNTSIYDTRSEEVEYDDEGNIINFKGK